MPPRSTAAPVRLPIHRRGRLRALLLVAATATGVLTGVIGTASPASALPTRTQLERTIDWTVHKLINRERAAHGLRPVRMAPELRLSARRHNLQMARNDQMSHQLPGEPSFGRRLIRAGYKWSYAGENIAWNSQMTKAGVVLLQKLMYREKPPYNDHRLNILNRNYRNVGVDVYVDKKHHKIWLTTDFGRRA